MVQIDKKVCNLHVGRADHACPVLALGVDVDADDIAWEADTSSLSSSGPEKLGRTRTLTVPGEGCCFCDAAAALAPEA